MNKQIVKVKKNVDVIGLENGKEYNANKVFIKDENCYGFLIINDLGNWMVYNECFFDN